MTSSLSMKPRSISPPRSNLPRLHEGHTKNPINALTLRAEQIIALLQPVEAGKNVADACGNMATIVNLKAGQRR